MKSNLGNHYVEKKSLGENITYAIISGFLGAWFQYWFQNRKVNKVRGIDRIDDNLKKKIDLGIWDTLLDKPQTT